MSTAIRMTGGQSSPSSSGPADSGSSTRHRLKTRQRLSSPSHHRSGFVKKKKKRNYLAFQRVFYKNGPASWSFFRVINHLSLSLSLYALFPSVRLYLCVCVSRRP